MTYTTRTLKNDHFIAEVFFGQAARSSPNTLSIRLTSLDYFWTVDLQRNGYSYNNLNIFPAPPRPNGGWPLQWGDLPQYQTWFDWGLSDLQMWQAFNNEGILGRIRLTAHGFQLEQRLPQIATGGVAVLHEWPPKTRRDMYLCFKLGSWTGSTGEHLAVDDARTMLRLMAEQVAGLRTLKSLPKELTREAETWRQVAAEQKQLRDSVTDIEKQLQLMKRDITRRGDAGASMFYATAFLWLLCFALFWAWRS